MYKDTTNTTRILHCPDNLGNNAKQLSDYQKEQGLNSWSISPRKEQFGFEADQTLVKSGSFVLGEFARWRLLWIAIFNFDVIHFNNGRTIMPHRLPFASVRKRTNSIVAALYVIYAWVLEGKDLFILKALGKKIYFTYQGSDARLSSHYFQLHSGDVLTELNPDYLSPKADQYKLRRIKRTEKYAEGIICLNPDLLTYFSSKAKFQPYYNIDLNEIKPHKILESNTVHIVHAPSKRDIKGTKYIVNAINELREKNSNLRFSLVEGMSNRKAQKIYDTADIFIDQLIVGWYGGVAVELMARGVPVMCFINSSTDIQDTQIQSIESKLPILKTSIETIKTDLENLLKLNKAEIRAIGENSRIFVNEEHRL